MSYTASDLITSLQDRLDDTAFPSATLLRYLNDTQREILNTTRFRFMEGEQTYTLVIGNDSVGTVPSDYQTPISLRITAPNGRESYLNYLEYEDFDRQWPSTDSTLYPNNQPSWWYTFDDAIKVWMRPDQAYTAKFKYLQAPTELVNLTDVPQIPVAFRELLELGMLKRAHMRNDQYTKAQVVDQEFRDQLGNMIERMSIRHLDSLPVIGSIGRG